LDRAARYSLQNETSTKLMYWLAGRTKTDTENTMAMRNPNQKEAVLMTTLINGELYGREIGKKYETRTGLKMPIGSLYTTLERREQRGFVRPRDGAPDRERGGNRRLFFRLTADGYRIITTVQAWFATEPE